MHLLLLIILSTIVGYLLFLFNLSLGGIIVFDIIVGCLLRALYLLKDISQSVLTTSSKSNRVKTAYNNYAKEKI